MPDFELLVFIKILFIQAILIVEDKNLFDLDGWKTTSQGTGVVMVFRAFLSIAKYDKPAFHNSH